MNSSFIKPFLLVFVITLAACDNAKTPEKYQQYAQTLMTQGDYSAAVIELKNALQKTPENAQIRLLLGKAYLFVGEINGAKKELQRAQKLGVDASLVLPLLIRTNLLLGDRQALLTGFDMSQEIDLDSKTQLLALSGIGLTYLGQQAQGLQLLAQVLTTGNEQSFYYKMAKAWVAGNNEQLEQAIALTQSLVVTDNEFDDAQLLLANLYIVAKDYPAAIKDFKAYIKEHPHNVMVRLNYISVLLQIENLENAEPEIDYLLQRFPDSSFSNEFKAEISLRKRLYNDAAEYASVALTSQPNLFKANLIAGIAHYQTKNYEMAYHYLQTIEKQLPVNHFGSQILTMVKLKLGYTEDAITAIDALETITEQEFSLLANASMALLQSGKQQKASEYITRMDSITTSDSATLSKRGVFKLAVEDASGIDDLRQAIAINPEYDQARLALIFNFIKNQQYQDALAVADAWVADFPEKENGYLAQGVIWRKQNNSIKALAAFNKALKQNPNSVGALYNLAVLGQEEDQFSAAFSKLKQLLTVNPRHHGGLNLLVEISSKLEDKQQVITSIEQLIEQGDDDLLLQMTKAKILEQLGDRDLALKLLTELEAKAVNNKLYFSTVAKMAFRAKDFALAERMSRQLIILSANSFKAYYGLFVSLQAQKKYQQAFSEVKKAQKVFPNNKNLLLFEVNYLLSAKSFKQAKLVLDSIVPSQVDSNMLLTTQVKYHNKTKDFATAKIFAQKLFNNQANYDNSLLYAKTLQQLQEHENALTIVNGAIEKFGETLIFKNLKAELTVKTNPQYSLAYYQDLAKKNPDNFVVLNNLAWSAIMAKEFSLGLVSAEKAAKLVPDQPQVLDTLAYAQIKMGKYQQAYVILEKIRLQLPDNQEVQLHYAEVLIHLKKITEAEMVLTGVADSQEKQQVLSLLTKTQG